MAMVGLERSMNIEPGPPVGPRQGKLQLHRGWDWGHGRCCCSLLAQSIAGHFEHNPAGQSFCKGDLTFFLTDYLGSEDGLVQGAVGREPSPHSQLQPGLPAGARSGEAGGAQQRRPGSARGQVQEARAARHDQPGGGKAKGGFNYTFDNLKGEQEAPLLRASPFQATPALPLLAEASWQGVAAAGCFPQTFSSAGKCLLHPFLCRVRETGRGDAAEAAGEASWSSLQRVLPGTPCPRVSMP